MDKPKTNVEFITELMEFARSGPLMQAFVIQAIERFAKDVQAAGPEACNTPLVNGHAWHACATECIEKIDAMYGSGW